LTFVEPRMQLWYIRGVLIPTASTDPIDIPEFWPVVAQHVIVSCLSKELGSPRLAMEKETLLQMTAQMIETLTEMVPDQDDTVEADTSSYEEQGLEV
jgi:hypothetical protein